MLLYKMLTTVAPPSPALSEYESLLQEARQVILTPIRKLEDLDVALTMLSKLWRAPKGTPEGNLLEVLMDLIEIYEQRTVPPIGPPSLKFAIAEALKAQGLKQKDLVPDFGDKTAVSRLVNGKRRPTLEQARLLHHRLGIDPDTILADLKAHIIRAED